VDILSSNLVRTLHFEAGLDSELGCRCELCRAAEEAEEAMVTEEVSDRVVDLNLAEMWAPGTRDRLALDQKLTSFVTTMLRSAGSSDTQNVLHGVAAADVLRQHYGHLIDFEGDKPGADYCPDLAFVLADLFCTGGLIHRMQQPVDNFIFWPTVYAKAVNVTRISLPHTCSQSLLARCYGFISAYSLRKTDEERRADMDGFVVNLIALRAIHNGTFGTTAYLSIIDKALPIVGDLAYALRDVISGLEKDMRESAAKREQEQHQANIRRGFEQTAHETGEAQLAVEEGVMNYSQE
jgi:hypothetical protein